MDTPVTLPSKILIGMDDVFDYIPLVSTLTNLVDIFIKYVILPHLSAESVQNNHYYSHLEQKQLWRCLVLSIPCGIGNLALGIYDFCHRKWNDKAYMLDLVQRDEWAFQRASAKIKNDREVVIAAVTFKGTCFLYASERLQNDREVVLATVRSFGAMLADVSEIFRQDREIVMAAVTQRGTALQYAAEHLKDDYDIALAAVTQNGAALEYVSQELRDNYQISAAALFQERLARHGRR
jgi:hypothetical protein